MKTCTRFIVFVLVLVISLLGVSTAIGAKESGKTQLRIVHTNDIHAQIEDFGKLADYVSTNREQSDIFLYLDGGDISSGNPAVDLPKGKPMIELLNEIGLDVLGIGNHEFDYGVEAFNTNYDLSEFDWLSANMEVKDSEIVQPEPYKIFEEDGIKIGVISLTQAPPATAPKNIEGIEFHEYHETIKNHKALRDEVDVLIGLNHIGYGEDQDLAREFDIFDAIIGGHSHTKVNQPAMINGTPVVQTGSHLNWIGNLTLDIDNESKEVTYVNWEIDPVESLTEVDVHVQEMVDGYLAEVEEKMSEVIGETTGLSSSGKNNRDVPLGNFWTDAMKDMVGADMAFTNGGGIRTSIDAGPLTVRDIYEVEPFGNQVMEIDMTGQAIKDVLEFSYTRDGRNQIDLQVSGLHYKILTNSSGNYVDVELMLNGEPLDLDKIYNVAVPDYIGSGGSGYKFVGDVITNNAGVMTEAMIEYAKKLMEDNDVIDYESEGRIQIGEGEGGEQEETKSVSEAIANNEGIARVEGYIVGHVVSTNNYNFKAPFTNDHNLLVADDPNEQDVEKMLPVQITAQFRGDFGLETNPDLIGNLVTIEGDLEPYFTVPGLKDPTTMNSIETLPISEVRDQSVDQEITTEGTVASIPGAWGGSSFYLHDGTGGILVYGFDLDVEQGDYIRLTGKLGEFNGEIQFDEVSNINILKQDQPLPEPYVVTPHEVSDNNIGELVSLQSVTVSELEEQDFGTFEFIATLEDESVSIRVDSRTGLTYGDFPFEDGDVIDVVGFVGVYQGTYQVKPRYAEDILESAKEVESLDTLIDGLSDQLKELIDASHVRGPLQKQLGNSLKQAKHHLNKGSEQKAIKFVKKFQTHLNNKGMQKFISPQAKEELITESDNIINQ